MIDRRRFVTGSLAAGFAAACSAPSSGPPGQPSAQPSAQPAPKPPAPKPAAKQTILVLGGTGFLGPHVVAAAQARGHTLTLFNRGKTHPGLFPEVEKLQGGRDGKLDALVGRKWDAVVDTSGYVPRIVKLSAELLAPNINQYVFISTISVYADHAKVGADETAKLSTIADPTNEEVKVNYGALKALSEQAAEAALPGRVTNIRPGLIIGPGDPTGRYSHWATRMAEGGEVLCPGTGATPTQYIDGRDLGVWIVKAIEDRAVGVFNALGPAERVTMKATLDGTNEGAGGKGKPVWVDAAFLEQHGVAPWSELPMWFDTTGEMAGFGTMSNARAVKAGLSFRPIRDTARDTLAWLDTLTDPAERTKFRSTGIARDKELKVLAAWKARP
ncbi:MAG: NAD-dependent epimerase/dehydratase family protein [Kofleriaceae bacterium]